MSNLPSIATTTRIEVCDAAVNELSEREKYLPLVVSSATDGSCSMTEKRMDLSTYLLQCWAFDFEFSLHHSSEVLSAKTTFKLLQEIMNVVTNLINYIFAYT